jgi:Flp pilus assembly protein TadG
VEGAPDRPLHRPHLLRRLKAAEQGQALVEFTLVVVPLLILLFGIIEFGLVMYDKNTVVSDAREAARLAAVNDMSGKTLLSDAPSGSTLTFTCSTDPNSGNAAGAYNVGDRVTAHITYVHSYVVPLIGNLLGGSINLSSNATMTLETQPTNFC